MATGCNAITRYNNRIDDALDYLVSNTGSPKRSKGDESLIKMMKLLYGNNLKAMYESTAYIPKSLERVNVAPNTGMCSKYVGESPLYGRN